jgi:hypothetical protein
LKGDDVTVNKKEFLKFIEVDKECDLVDKRYEEANIQQEDEEELGSETTSRSLKSFNHSVKRASLQLKNAD